MRRSLILVLFFLFIQNAIAETKTAIFAGGCFWCMEPPFDKLDGVNTTISGYINGHTKNPNYKQVSTGKTGHYEVLKITYDDTKVSFETLLDVLWKNIDPFDDAGQFCDKGPQYRSAIFYVDDKQEQIAEKNKNALQLKLGNQHKLTTPILAAEEFYPAEEYHQDYYEKNPIRYKYYRYGCGRDKRLEEVNAIYQASS
ncbi:MAG: peptide-methionine (S)-S-oxide reductase MsrA [Pseudomonadota bacterium]